MQNFVKLLLLKNKSMEKSLFQWIFTYCWNNLELLSKGRIIDKELIVKTVRQEANLNTTQGSTHYKPEHKSTYHKPQQQDEGRC